MRGDPAPALLEGLLAGRQIRFARRRGSAANFGGTCEKGK